MPNTQISKYQAVIYAGDRPSLSRATILLLDENQSTIGILFFVADGTLLPPNEAFGVPHGFYYMGDYAAVLDLLRNESPVYIETGGKTDVSISTRAEPIGDGDKAPAKLFPML